MKRVFTFMSFFLLLGCSNDSDETLEQEPVVIYKNFILDQTAGLNQFNVFQIKPDGKIIEYDYEDGQISVSVNNLDEIIVSCKVGEKVMPTVNYRVYSFRGREQIIHQSGTLYSEPNIISEWGFRLMKTADGKDRIKIED